MLRTAMTRRRSTWQDRLGPRGASGAAAQDFATLVQLYAENFATSRSCRCTSPRANCG
jgi:hypothetical protein